VLSASLWRPLRVRGVDLMGSCLTVYLLEAGGVGMFRPCARTSGIAIALPKPQDLTLFGWV